MKISSKEAGTHSLVQVSTMGMNELYKRKVLILIQIENCVASSYSYHAAQIDNKMICAIQNQRF